jgi:hypothetical protein
MPDQTKPPLPLPEPLRGADPDSFAQYSVAVRLVKIARQTMEENAFSSYQTAALEKLYADIPEAKIRPILDREASDSGEWVTYVEPYLGMDWLEAPWFFVENYFYRRILEATGYFQEGVGSRLDPFRFQKRSGFDTSLAQIQGLCYQLNRFLNDPDPGWNASSFLGLLYSSLWGNQVDLSLWPAGEGQRPDHANLEQAQAYLLVNDTPVLQSTSTKNGGGRVDILVDNAGFELVADLCLVDYLLSTALAEVVRLHVKAYPTFVSDAMAPDVEQTIQNMTSLSDEDSRMVGKRLGQALSEDRLQLASSAFWNSPLPAWEMPTSLRIELGESSLVISKGDANYRRATGDRHWPFTFPFQDILRYFPASFLALRVMKSEVVLGLEPVQIQDMPRKDPDWMVNGRWGLIQFKP